MNESKLIKKSAKHLKELQALALSAIQESECEAWRHHGTGMLQLYLTPSHRLHVWHPMFLFEGMTQSGAWHDHRFSLGSTVLAGELLNTEIVRKSRMRFAGVENKKLDIWGIPGASKGDTTSLEILERSITHSFGPTQWYETGDSYFIARGHFHWARQEEIPYGHVTVTSVVMFDKQDVPAKLLTPVDVKPVHAFEKRARMEDIRDILSMAKRELKRLLF